MGKLCSISLTNHDENSHHDCTDCNAHRHSKHYEGANATCSRPYWLAFCRVYHLVQLLAVHFVRIELIEERLDAVSVTKLLAQLSVSGWVVILSAAVVLSDC